MMMMVVVVMHNSELNSICSLYVGELSLESSICLASCSPWNDKNFPRMHNLRQNSFQRINLIASRKHWGIKWMGDAFGWMSRSWARGQGCLFSSRPMWHYLSTARRRALFQSGVHGLSMRCAPGKDNWSHWGWSRLICGAQPLCVRCWVCLCLSWIVIHYCFCRWAAGGK